MGYYTLILSFFSNSGEKTHLVDSFRNNGLAFAGLLASSYAYLDNHMDGVASSHIHHNGLNDGDLSLEHALKRYHADLGTVNKLNDDVDGARYTYLFCRYDNGLAYSYDHACLARPYAHDWLYTHFQMCDRDFLGDNDSFGCSYRSCISHPLCQVAISYETVLLHEPIHMKEKNRLFSREKEKQVKRQALNCVAVSSSATLFTSAADTFRKITGIVASRGIPKIALKPFIFFMTKLFFFTWILMAMIVMLFMAV